VAHYRVAYRIDELFWWAANNLAWEVATTPWLNQRDGELALQFAVEVDRRSEGQCWSFLDTLAAAHAAAGDFERAVAVAERALTLDPAEEQ
jgi:regulator of sirC expression with transglutaminase-like and TPR domain